MIRIKHISLQEIDQDKSRVTRFLVIFKYIGRMSVSDYVTREGTDKSSLPCVRKGYVDLLMISGCFAVVFLLVYKLLSFPIWK